VGQGGMAVAGDAGTVTVPADARVTIAPDGSISSLDARGVVTALGRLRLLNPSQQEVERGDDGLFRLVSGVTAQADGRVRVAAGRLEGSNVNAVDAMVRLISQARSFELQMSLLKNAESNEAKASQIVALN
ncbi:MAG: flagellar basal-body rod protein FlgF, partial [Pseudomonadota bacterium]